VIRLKHGVSNPKPAFSDADIQQLMQIGYTMDVSVYALDACQGDVNKACDLLIECGSV